VEWSSEQLRVWYRSANRQRLLDRIFYYVKWQCARLRWRGARISRNGNSCSESSMDYIGRSSYVSEHMWLIGGQFNYAGGDLRHGFAVYDLPGNAPLQSDNTETEEYVRTANSLQKQFTVYPNPAHGIVTLKLNDPVSGKLNITVTDMNGKKVLQQSQEGNYLNYIKVNTSALKNGTYVIALTGEDINFNSIVVIAN
jgi:hypothetical protein